MCPRRLGSSLLLFAAIAQPALSDEDSYVNIQVPIEIRGMLKKSNEGLSVETRERVQIRSDKPARIEWHFITQKWDLDMRMAGEYQNSIRDLEGKVVIIKGVAPLYQVESHHFFGGREDVSLSWRLERKLTVLTLKAAEKP